MRRDTTLLACNYLRICSTSIVVVVGNWLDAWLHVFFFFFVREIEKLEFFFFYTLTFLCLCIVIFLCRYLHISLHSYSCIIVSTFFCGYYFIFPCFSIFYIFIVLCNIFMCYNILVHYAILIYYFQSRGITKPPKILQYFLNIFISKMQNFLTSIFNTILTLKHIHILHKNLLRSNQ